MAESALNNEFRQLKALLLEDEKNSLEQIQNKISHIDETFDENIVKVFKKSSEQPKGEISQLLSKQVSSGLKSEIKNNPAPIIDSLSPIMGAMITSYVTESIKELSDKISENIEQQLPYQRISRKIKSKLTGASESDLLLTQIEHKPLGVFIIEKGSGLLIYHNADDKVQLINPTLFAGMLTALTDFAKDSVAGGSKLLSEIDYGDFDIFISHLGSLAFAFISKGKLSPKQKRLLREVSEFTFEKHKDVILGEDNIDPREFHSDVDKMISKQNEDVQKKEKGSLIKPFLIVLTLVLASLFIYKYTEENKALVQIQSNPLFKSISKLEAKKSINGKVYISAEVPTKSHIQLFKQTFPFFISNLSVSRESESSIIEKLKLLINSFNTQGQSKIKLEVIDAKIFLKGVFFNKEVQEKFKNDLLDKKLSQHLIDATTLTPTKLNFSYLFKYRELQIPEEIKQSLINFLSQENLSQNLKISLSIDTQDSLRNNVKVNKKRLQEVSDFIKKYRSDIKIETEIHIPKSEERLLLIKSIPSAHAL